MAQRKIPMRKDIVTGEMVPKKELVRVVKNKEGEVSINPEVLIVSEMWDFAINRGNPQIYDGQVDSVMNYPFTDAIHRWVRYGNYLHYDAYTRNIAKYP